MKSLNAMVKQFNQNQGITLNHIYLQTETEDTHIHWCFHIIILIVREILWTQKLSILGTTKGECSGAK